MDRAIFSVSPSVGRYIKGIPIIAYEGILIDSDTKLKMFTIVWLYNGSLAAETQ